MIKLAFSLLLATSTLLVAHSKSTQNLIDKAKVEAKQTEVQVLKKMLDDEVDFVLLDIREPEQQLDGEIYAGDSYAITRGNLEFQIENNVKNKDTIIVTYCRAGNAAALAAQTLKNMGYQHASSLKGGLHAWVEAGYSVETALGSMKLVLEEE